MELVLGSIVLRGLVVIVLGLCGELMEVACGGQLWLGPGGRVVLCSRLGKGAGNYVSWAFVLMAKELGGLGAGVVWAQRCGLVVVRAQSCVGVVG